VLPDSDDRAKLVIASDRRPIHVLNSPIKLEKENLISWAKQLAHAGNVFELVDERLRDDYCHAPKRQARFGTQCSYTE